jgi:hypothetical protein
VRHRQRGAGPQQQRRPAARVLAQRQLLGGPGVSVPGGPAAPLPAPPSRAAARTPASRATPRCRLRRRGRATAAARGLCSA